MIRNYGVQILRVNSVITPDTKMTMTEESDQGLLYALKEFFYTAEYIYPCHAD